MAKGVHDKRYRSLISQLADRRVQLGLSQSEIAAALGRRQQYVSKYESFERRLDVIEFAEAARALDLDPGSMVSQAVGPVDGTQ